jgi:hypothetical protein
VGSPGKQRLENEQNENLIVLSALICSPIASASQNAGRRSRTSWEGPPLCLECLAPFQFTGSEYSPCLGVSNRLRYVDLRSIGNNCVSVLRSSPPSSGPLVIAKFNWLSYGFGESPLRMACRSVLVVRVTLQERSLNGIVKSGAERYVDSPYDFYMVPVAIWAGDGFDDRSSLRTSMTNQV